MIRRAYLNWRKRHLKPVNFALHVVGIPACFVAAPVLLGLERGALALAAFAGGYTLQFLGHVLEHNRSGEEMLIRRLINRP